MAFGVKQALGARHRLSTDVIWYDWSHAFDRFDIKFTNASSPAFAGTTLHDSIALDWDDSISLRLGYEFLWTAQQAVRLGYVYHPSPVPDSTLTPLIPATLEHDFAIGYSHRWKRYSVDLAYIYTFGSERTVSTSSIVGGDFDNSSIEAEYHVVFVGFSIRF